jgi:HTH-type transcriptional regulator / antitoxin HipB
MNVVIKDVEQLGRLAREMRKSLGLKQADVAAAAGIGLRLLVEIERGKATAQVGKVLQVLDVLGFEVRLSDE